MLRLAVVFALAALAGCSKKESSGQSFAQAMEIICSAHRSPEAEHANPAERNMMIARWVDEKVTNPEARELFAALGSQAPAEANRRLQEAATRAGLPGCAMVEDLDPMRAVAMPEVDAADLAPIAPGTPMLVIHAHGMVLEGQSVDEPERLARFATALLERGPDRTIAIAADPAVPYARLFSALTALAGAGARPALLVRGRGAPGLIPIALPEARPAAALQPSAEPADVPVGLTIALTRQDAIVFSISGLEGTLQEPRARLVAADLPRLAATLAELKQRRPDERRLLVLADGDLEVGAVAAVLAAAHASFPEVMLGSGFQ